jgi:hypothetical protein
LGCNISGSDTTDFINSCDIAKKSDVTIIVSGLDQSQEAEGHDRLFINFPGVQEKMIKYVTSCSKGPVIVVMMNGGPIDLTNIKNDEKINSILWVGYPGQSGGEAIAKVIFGDYSPAGRLPYTIYPSNYITQVSMEDMGMRPNRSNGNPGRTYRFYTGENVYPFGFGLSYTNFTYEFSTKKTIITKEKLESLLLSDPSPFSNNPIIYTTITVINTGKRISDNIITAFIIGPEAGINGNPLKTLFAFKRIHNLKPGEKYSWTFPVNAYYLSYINKEGKNEIVKGIWKIVIENSEQLIQII